MLIIFLILPFLSITTTFLTSNSSVDSRENTVMVTVLPEDAIDFYKKPFKSKSLSGVVALSDEKPIFEAKVQLVDKTWKNVIDETQTSKDGSFSFPNQKGFYYIQISKQGFHTLRVKAKIQPSKKYPALLQLKMTLS